MDLHYQTFPNDFFDLPVDERSKQRPPVIIIPGLFGSTANWRGIAKNLSQYCPVVVIDQRNHGRSPHADSNSYLDMVGDLLGFLDQHQLTKVVLCGHSMGGKVAMLFALLHPEYVVKLAVLDIAPVTYQHSHAPFLEELLKVDLAELESRSDADRQLVSVIPDTGTRMFLLQSLAGSADSFYWRINLSVLHEFMPQLVAFPKQIVALLTNTCPVLVVIGGDSDYVQTSDYSKIWQYFSNAEFETITDAGHWLHAEQPAKVLEQLKLFIET